MADDLLTSIKFFLDDILVKSKYDLIVTIEKTGYRLFHLVKEKGLKSSIPSIASLAIEEEVVKDKRILLFDDRINTGKTVSDIKKQLLELGAAEVHTAVYASDETSIEKAEYTSLTLNGDNRDDYRENVSRITENLNYPYYTDQIFIEGIIKGNNYSKESLERSLEGLGRISTVGIKHKNGVNDTSKISLSDLNFLNMEDYSTDEYDVNKDNYKIRIYSNDSGEITIVPFGIPEVTPKKDHPGIHKDFTYCLCEKHKNNRIILRDDPEWTLCNWCITFNLGLIVLERFLAIWKANLFKLGFSFDVIGFVNEHVENIFKDPEMTNQLTNILFGELNDE